MSLRQSRCSSQAVPNHVINWQPAADIRARRSGVAADPLAADYPGVEDGALGVRFIEKVVESAASERKWTLLD